MQQEQAGDVIVNCNGIEIFDNEFELAIDEACEKYGIEDLTEASQRQWKAVMRYVGKRVFTDTQILRDKNTVLLEGNKIPTNNNRFDYNIINTLCDYYMSMSDRYNKLISAEAFSLLLNMPRETISLWGSDEPSTLRFNIYKKLKDYRLECIKDNAYDNGNVTGTMYVGNVEFGTNLPGVSREQSGKRSLTDAELPKLSENNQTKAIEMDVSRETQFQTI